jgi:hypothetical protein
MNFKIPELFLHEKFTPSQFQSTIQFQIKHSNGDNNVNLKFLSFDSIEYKLKFLINFFFHSSFTKKRHTNKT